MQDSTGAKLIQIFLAILNLPENSDFPALKQESEPAWDSLAHALLTAALESEFGLQIDAAESLELTSYHAVATLLTERGL